MTLSGGMGAPLPRMALVLWSGALGGAETFSVALARTLRASGIGARLIILTHAEPLAQRCREAGVPFSELQLERGRAALWHPRRFARTVGADEHTLRHPCRGGVLPSPSVSGAIAVESLRWSTGARLQTDVRRPLRG